MGTMNCRVVCSKNVGGSSAVCVVFLLVDGEGRNGSGVMCFISSLVFDVSRRICPCAFPCCCTWYINVCNFFQYPKFLMRVELILLSFCLPCV